MEEAGNNQSGQISRVLEGSLKAVNTQLVAGLEGLQKEMASQKDTSQKALGEAMEALKKYVEESIAGQVNRVEESRGAGFQGTKRPPAASRDERH